MRHHHEKWHEVSDLLFLFLLKFANNIFVLQKILKGMQKLGRRE